MNILSLLVCNSGCLLPNILYYVAMFVYYILPVYCTLRRFTLMKILSLLVVNQIFYYSIQYVAILYANLQGWKFAHRFFKRFTRFLRVIKWKSNLLLGIKRGKRHKPKQISSDSLFFVSVLFESWAESLTSLFFKERRERFSHGHTLTLIRVALEENLQLLYNTILHHDALS